MLPCHRVHTLSSHTPSPGCHVPSSRQNACRFCLSVALPHTGVNDFVIGGDYRDKNSFYGGLMGPVLMYKSTASGKGGTA